MSGETLTGKIVVKNQAANQVHLAPQLECKGLIQFPFGKRQEDFSCGLIVNIDNNFILTHSAPSWSLLI